MRTSEDILHQQRSHGRVRFEVERSGLQVMRESGAAKVRFPQGGIQAILINTGGGLAGGDNFGFSIRAGADTKLSVTSQAAERVYRTLGPAAAVRVSLSVGDHASLQWLPQESILFDGSALVRSIDVELSESARFLAVEPVVFGRKEMGENIGYVRFRDRWRIRRGGELIFADDIAISGEMPKSKATLDGAGAIATMLLVGADAETHLDAVRATIGGDGGASAWNGKLVARIVARDGFELRKALIPALFAVAGDGALPEPWTW